jgi:predicted RNase H-like HicB family nuclease
MSVYFGILDGKEGAYGIRIPDCPGAFGAGATVAEAIQSATKGLAVWAAAQIKDGLEMPPMRGALGLGDDADDMPGPGEAIVMIPLLLDAGRTVKANVTFDAGLLETIDQEAQRRGLTRSAFLASAAREKIEASR